MKPRATILLLACLLCSGCATNIYKGKGVWLFRQTIGTDQQIGVFVLGKDGSITFGGSESKQSESTGRVAEAAADVIKPTLLP
jgi:hypothetical protein